MGTSWSKESKTKALSTGSTAATSFTIDDGESFLIKDSGANNILTLAEDTGNFDVKGTINLGSSSYMTLNNNEIDVSSGDLTVDVAGDILLDAGGNDVKFQVGGVSYMEWNSGQRLKLMNASNVGDYFQIDISAGNGQTILSTEDDNGVLADLKLDVDGDIILDTASNVISLTDNGTNYARFVNNSTNLQIKSGSSHTVALTFSGADATFANDIDVTGRVTTNDIRCAGTGNGHSTNLVLGTSGSNMEVGAIYNVFVGANAGHDVTDGDANTCIGYGAGQNITSSYGVYVGKDAGKSMTSSYGTIVGEVAGYHTTGGGNCFFGGNSGYYVSTGASNTAVGHYTLSGSGSSIGKVTGDNNTCLGYQVGKEFRNDNANNTLVGSLVASEIQAIDNCTFVGYNITPGTNRDKSIVIGNTIADANIADSQFTIGEGSNVIKALFTHTGNKYFGISTGTTGGSSSAGSGNQYVELDINGTVYKVLHDGTV